MKVFIWIAFLVISVAMWVQLQALKPSGYTIIDFELASKKEGLLILKQWLTGNSGSLSLLSIARNNTQWDVLFILIYATLFITLSNWQMQREKWIPLNEALRLNLLLTFLAALLDIFENIGMLHNFNHVGDAAGYWNTHWFALIKFIFLGIALLIFMVSFLKSKVLSLR